MKLSIVVPVRNETLNLKIMAKVMSAILETEYEIIFVYDSIDDASAVAAQEVSQRQPHIIGLLNDIGPGVANAIRSAVVRAQSEYIVVFVADEIVPILAIPHMVKLMDDGCDFVNATRYGYGGRRVGGSLVGHALSSLANRAFRLMTFSPLTDCTSGVKMFRRSQFDDLMVGGREQGWGFAFEMAINAQRLGYQMGEVPTISVDRMFGGKSTFSLVPWAVNYLKVFFIGIGRLPPRPFRQKPNVSISVPENIFR